jgi:hypothetical protein
MDRVTKLIVVVWTVGLLVVDLAIGRAWSGMPVAAAVVFAAFALLNLWDPRTVGVVLAFACVYPAVIRLTLETYAPQFDVLWMAALLGAILPGALRSRWHIAHPWRSALVYSALAVAIGTSIVAFREIDFNVGLLDPPPSAVLSGLPRYFAEWVVTVGLTLLLGLLWFDWLCGPSVVDFDAVIIWPIGASMIVMAGMAQYQMFGDIAFLNETAYAAVERAAGTMYDANVCGTLAAMAVAVPMHVATRASGWRRAVMLGVVLLFIMAVWATGSRTAFAATIVIVLTGALSAWRARTHDAARRPVMAIVALAVGVAAFVALVSTVGSNSIGPLGRLWDMVPSLSGVSVGRFIAEMWNRNGYGTASTHLIEQFPLSGIGVGAFHIFGAQASPVAGAPPDNAQNWWRHQIVELGLLGAAGWLVFSARFAWLVLAPGRTLPSPAGPARGILLAFGLISLVGMPTQQATAAVVFWTAAAWYSRSVHQGSHDPAVTAQVWLAMALGLMVFSVSTTQTALHDLRVPVRARHMGWPYSYGFYEPEPDGAGGYVRWTARRATALVDARGPVMTISVQAPHPDIDSHPVDVVVWSEGRKIINRRLETPDATSATVTLPPGLKTTLVDVKVSRIVRPRDFGFADDREVGVLMKWDFSEAP